LQATSYKLQATSYKLQATSYKLQATSYKLCSVGWERYGKFPGPGAFYKAAVGAPFQGANRACAEIAQRAIRNLSVRQAYPDNTGFVPPPTPFAMQAWLQQAVGVTS
ncbi:MAG: hypothetical protein CL544_04940, partial [Alcanivorax sp.]|nr:hypothetical protein [Alcanivorax sp.]